MAATRATVGLGLLSLACSDFSIDDRDEVSVRSVPVEETFLQVPNPQLDLLWLVDNTPSMQTEHEQLLPIVREVIGELDDLDASWHLGVITPDGQGVLRGNPWVLTPTNTTEDALTELFDVGTSGSVPERGLASLVAALTSPTADHENRGFRRPGASLHVVVFSDGDDESDASLGSDAVSAASTALTRASSASPQPARVSAIVGLEDEPCLGPSGGATAAPRYRALVDQVGGALTPICSPDIEPIVLAVTDLRAHLPRTFTLQTAPVAGSARVAIDGERQDSGWRLSGPAIVFDTPPPIGSTVTVRYRVTG